MIIIFPMAGLSSRFAKAGYLQPKYMLTLNKQSVFFNAVNSFKTYFNKFKILFIYRDIQNTKNFIEQECLKMNLKFYEAMQLDFTTMGQAHTVMLGIQKANISDDESILIFNIDTFRPNFHLPKDLDFNTIDGYLEVFEGIGDNWSFVLAKDTKVIKTAEKERISSLCSSGLYYFKRVKDFKESFLNAKNNNAFTKNELYIAPLYNYLIWQGKNITFKKINLNEIIFCGTAKEYENLKNNF